MLADGFGYDCDIILNVQADHRTFDVIDIKGYTGSV